MASSSNNLALLGHIPHLSMQVFRRVLRWHEQIELCSAYWRAGYRCAITPMLSGHGSGVGIPPWRIQPSGLTSPMPCVRLTKRTKSAKRRGWSKANF